MSIGLIVVAYLIGVVAMFMLLMLADVMSPRCLPDDLIPAASVVWPIALPLLLIVVLTYVLKQAFNLFVEALSD